MVKTTRSSQIFNLFLVVLIDLIGFGMIIPLIPFLGKSTGVSAIWVGLLMAIYSLMQFLFSPFWGALSDRYGRKPVLLVSIFGACISHGVFAFVSSYSALFLTRLFAGLFSANISTAMASASDLSTKENRTQTMGVIGAAFGLGFVIGPFLGAQGASLGNSIGFGDQFSSLLASLLCLINFIFCLFIFKESLLNKVDKIKINYKKLNPISALLDCDKKTKEAVLLFFSATLSLALIEVVLFFVVDEYFGWGYKKASLGFAAIGLVMAFTQGGLIRPLKKRLKESQIIFIGGILFTLGLQGAFIFDGLSLFATSIILLSFGYALLNPALNGYISLLSSSDSQGKTFGVTHGFSALSRIIGPVLGTYFLQVYSSKTPFLVASSIIGISLVFFIISLKRKN